MYTQVIFGFKLTVNLRVLFMYMYGMSGKFLGTNTEC